MSCCECSPMLPHVWGVPPTCAGLRVWQDTVKRPLLCFCRYNAALYHHYGATTQALAGYQSGTGGIAGKAPFSLSVQVCVLAPAQLLRTVR